LKFNLPGRENEAKRTPTQFIQKRDIQVDESKMEAPIIVKSINRGITSMKEDAWNQAVGMTPQSISNRQAYDLFYPNHKSYYEDKKFFIFDKNYNQMEKALVDTFERAVDSSINKNIKHVDELRDPKLNVDFDRIPRVKTHLLILRLIQYFQKMQ
jgi:hypothetical protein